MISKNKAPTGSLTNSEDWSEYYAKRDLASLEQLSKRETLLDEFFNQHKGSIFELGCGQSAVLAKASQQGWKVGGIDFNAKAIEVLKVFVAQQNGDIDDLVVGDVFEYSTKVFSERFDLLGSYGFLEHFTNPGDILKRWVEVIKPGGMVVTTIPNLFSINGKIFKKFDPEFWEQHVAYTAEDVHEMHLNAGLEPVTLARYDGKFDIHTLIPWDKISTKIAKPIIFKLVKYISFYLIHHPLRFITPNKNSRLFNRRIIGIYRKP